MGGVGGPEVLVILIVALLVFGPKSIPDVARTIGKGARELRRLATEFQREMNLADAEDEERRRIRPPPRKVAADAAASAQEAPAAADVPPSGTSPSPEPRPGEGERPG